MSKPFESLSPPEILPIELEPISFTSDESDKPAVHTVYGGSLYLGLLIASLCLSLALCWLYVTKPVVITMSELGHSSEETMPLRGGAVSQDSELVEKENPSELLINPSE